MKYNGNHGWNASPLGAPSDVGRHRPALLSNNNYDEQDDFFNDTSVSLDTIMGTTHYIPPSPEHFNRKTKEQSRLHGNHSSLSNQSITVSSSSIKERYPFQHRIKPSTDPSRQLLKKLTNRKLKLMASSSKNGTISLPSSNRVYT